MKFTAHIVIFQKKISNKQQSLHQESDEESKGGPDNKPDPESLMISPNISNYSELKNNQILDSKRSKNEVFQVHHVVQDLTNREKSILQVNTIIYSKILIF